MIVKRGGINRSSFIFASLFLVLVIVAIIASVFAYTGEIPNPGHGGDTILITSQDGTEVTLQDWIDWVNSLDIGSLVPTLPGDGLGSSSIDNVTFTGYGSSDCVISGGSTATKGQVSCSGYNKDGQLGIADTTARITFKKLSSFEPESERVKKIVGSALHFCALLVDGRVKCWGYNPYGQLGVGDTTKRLVPTDVNHSTPGFLDGTAGSNAIDIFVRRAYTGTYWVEGSCALTLSGKIYCWGYNNANGIIGDGSTVTRKNPSLVSGITNAKTIAMGGHSTGAWNCALLTDSTVKCWGYNGYGQLGVGDKASKITPVTVSTLSNVREIAVTPSDYGTACAIINDGTVNDGTVKCWGYNGQGQVGIGTTTDTTVPANTLNIGGANPKAVKLVSSGSGTRSSFCSLLEDGTVKCWGDNKNGRIGLPAISGDEYTTPTAVTGLSNVRDIKLLAWGDTGYGCALINDGTVKCWGSNGYGQLGIGSTTTTYNPTTVVGITNAESIFLGGNYGSGQSTCALLSDKSIRCWGYNGNGQLGTGDKINYLVPTQPS